MSIRVWNEENQTADLVSGYGIWSKINEKPFEVVDSALSDTSTNPVENKIVKLALDEVSGEANAISTRILQNENEGFTYDFCGWEQGTISTSTGEKADSTTRIRVVDFIPCEYGEKVYLYAQKNVAYLVINYNSSMALLSPINWTNGSGLIEITPNNSLTKYIKVVIKNTDESVIKPSDMTLSYVAPYKSNKTITDDIAKNNIISKITQNVGTCEGFVEKCGIVTLNYTIPKDTTNGTIIANISSGYRPNSVITTPLYNSNGCVGIASFSSGSGNITIYCPTLTDATYINVTYII